MTAKKPRAGGELLAIVQKSPPKPLAERGRALFVKDILEIWPEKTRWWVNNAFLPSKKQKAGRDNFWWECDVLAAIDSGDLSA